MKDKCLVKQTVGIFANESIESIFSAYLDVIA